jgi:stage V sporulation protein D (sporulation-specific penicillin-binding protein)
LAITFLFCLLFARFFYVQVIWQSELRALALDQWMREIPIVAKRGKIVDTNGVVLADSQTSYAVFARARAVTNKEAAAQILAKVLGTDEEKLLSKLQKGGTSEITVAREVDKEKIEELCAFDLDGVYYSPDNTRLYPYGSLLSQTIGFTSSDHSGTTGIEKYYDKYLAGTDGELLYETDLVGIDLDGAVAAYVEAEDGLNVQLTVDHAVQAIAEKAMKKVYEESNAVSAQCIVLDPQNFDILAMVNYPAYDLNDVPRDDSELLNSLSRNRLVCDIYEPGSTFKIITAAANIEEYLQGNSKAFSPSYVFPSSATRQVDGTTIKCWSTHAGGKHSNQTLADALNNSCNPCFVDMALSLGKETFYEYLDLFNFGKETGIDYSGEALGILLPSATVRDCDLARIGFGQTVAVTPLQLACAVAAAVNGGYYYTPRLVRRIYSDDKSTNEKIEGVLKRRTISEKASSMLAEMLEGVVSEGSGKKAYIKGYKVAGKTGTAQKYENGLIAQGKYVASFVGFFPSDNPKYLALIVVDEPQGMYYGSTVAAPCAQEIFQGIIDLKKITPYE